MSYVSYNTLVVLAGVGLLGVCAGLVGSFAVLRRRALIGDALAHAALPGVCLAFLAFRERSLPLLLLGGFLSGVLGVVVVTALRHLTRVKEDAAIGIVLSVFYGAGIVLYSRIQKSGGAGSRAGLDSYFLGKTSGMLLSDVYVIAGAALFCLLLIVLMYKEFKVTAFDPGFASVQGWPAFLLDLLLLAMIAVTVIIGLPAVGVVLMAALLIVPAATARFWTDRLGMMLVLSAVFGLVTGVGGALTTVPYSLPSGPMIVLTGTALFLGSMLFAPRRGVVARVLMNRAFRRRVAERRLLRLMYELGEDALPRRPAFRAEELRGRRSWSGTEVGRILSGLRDQGLVEETGSGYALTEPGLRRAATLERTHRLWELFLTEYPEMAGPLTNLDSESLDGRVPRDIVETLEAKLAASGRVPLALQN